MLKSWNDEIMKCKNAKMLIGWYAGMAGNNLNWLEMTGHEKQLLKMARQAENCCKLLDMA